MIVPQSCVLCEKEIENLWHILVTCSFARNCWKEIQLENQIQNSIDEAKGFSDWFFKVFKSLERLELGKFCVML